MPKISNSRAIVSVLTALTAVVLALACLVGVGTQAAGATGKTLYDVVPLEGGWTNTIARDINEKQQIAGQGTKSDLRPQAQAFLWEGEAVRPLGVPATQGNLSRARAINDDGAVVGEWRIGGGMQARFKAFLYEDGQMKDLNALISAGTGWELTGAQAINESRQVVGSGTKRVETPEGVREETHAFLYESGAVTDLGEEVLRNPYSAAWGINDSGDVVGGAGSAEAQSGAFVFRNGAVDRLSSPGPFSASEAVGINNCGQVIGWSFDPGQNPPQGKGFLYGHGGDGEAKFESLEPLDRPDTSPLSDDVYTRARDVDEAGRVVGWSRNDVGATQREQFSAVLWEEAGPEGKRQAQDLNDLVIPEDSGWKLVDAYAINEGGQIVGSGYHKGGSLQAFLLNPAYDFSGFFAPVDNPPTVNKVNAGRAILVKFSLAGDQGLDVLAEGYPISRRIDCDATDRVDAVEKTATAGSSGLSYDATTDQYTYVWKTEKAWTGCRQLVLKLDDGTVHRANFSFTKR